MLGFLLCCAVVAEEQSNWAKMAQNPMADIIKMPLENHFDFGYGHKEQVRYRMLYKPSMVSALSEEWNMVNRLNMPFIYQPGTVPGALVPGLSGVNAYIPENILFYIDDGHHHNNECTIYKSCMYIFAVKALQKSGY